MNPENPEKSRLDDLMRELPRGDPRIAYEQFREIARIVLSKKAIRHHRPTSLANDAWIKLAHIIESDFELSESERKRFVYRTMTHHLINQLERENTRRRHEQRTLDEHQFDDIEREQTEKCRTEDLVDKLHVIIDDLQAITPTRLAVFMRRYHANQTLKDISEQMGISETQAGQDSLDLRQIILRRLFE